MREAGVWTCPRLPSAVPHSVLVRTFAFCLLPFALISRPVSALPETGSLSPYLPDVYRFAFLMTGEAAAAATVLRRTVEHAARGGVGEMHDARRVKRWLFTEARHQCGSSPAAPASGASVPPEPEAGASAPLAARFARVPEAERGALILFYLYLFDPVELAEVLEIPAAELAPLLNRGRAWLDQTA